MMDYRLMGPFSPATSSGASDSADEAKDDDRKLVRLKTRFLGKSSSSRFDQNGEDPFVVHDIPKEKEFLMYFQLGCLCLIVLGLCFCSIPSFGRYQVAHRPIWKLLLMGLVTICGNLLSDWLVGLLAYVVEQRFILHKLTRQLYFVYGVRKSLQYCLWNLIVYLVWVLTFHISSDNKTLTTPQLSITMVLGCLLLSNLIWMVKTALVKGLAARFHINSYFQRTHESIFHHYIVQTLSGPPVFKYIEKDLLAEDVEKLKADKLAEDVEKTDKSINGLKIGHLHKLNQKTISGWNMKRLMKFVRGSSLTTFDQLVAQANRGDESAREIRDEQQAMLAANKIFSNVAKPDTEYIYLVDLMRFMREDEALKTMTLFEGAEDKNQVSRTCLKNWVVKVFKERKHLALTLNDTSTIVKKLHRMINVTLVLILVVLWLLLLGIAQWELFVIVGTLLLVFVFMFGNTVKRIFESTIFLFVTHPFDTGDRCEINGIQMVVEEMNILTTTFMRFDNQKITYPNKLLATLPIGNYYRSPVTWGADRSTGVLADKLF